MDAINKRIILAPKDYESELESECRFHRIHFKKITSQLYQVEKGPILYWIQNEWLHPCLHNFESIQSAAKFLKSQTKFWNLLKPTENYRRAQLIQDELPKWKIQPQQFLEPESQYQLGSWTLLDKNTLLCSPKCSSNYPNGVWNFNETKDPPSRAYLKLWELFGRLQMHPKKSDICVDLGSCPGGWTWVLAQLCDKVISVDKAEIDKRLLKNPHVHYLKQDAFKLDPASLPQVDWVFSDIICYPDKLLELANKWMSVFSKSHFVFTIKFKGKTDFKTIQKFSQIPNSKIIHLSVNKHELTWARYKT